MAMAPLPPRCLAPLLVCLALAPATGWTIFAGGSGAAADLDLTNAVYEQLVGVPAFECTDEPRLRVSPGKPEESYLVHKTNGVRLCAGSQMPPGQLLDLDVRRRISDWICIGAPDD